MKFKINRKDLSDSLNNLLRVVPNKSAIPALEGIFIKASDGQIELTAYNLEIGIKTLIPATIIEEGKIVVSAKLFSEIIRKAPDNIINITVNNHNQIKIESNYSNSSISGINADEFPELPNVENKNKFTVSSETLNNMIRQTIFCTTENEGKPIYKGILFKIEDDTLDLVAADGNRLAKRSEKITCNFNDYFIVPGKTLNELSKISTDEEAEVEIILSRRHIMFKVENYIIVSTILEGEFFDYKNAIPKKSTFELKIKTKDFIESTERVSILLNDRLKSYIRCNIDNDTIKLSCSSSIGKAEDSFHCKTDGNIAEIGFHNRYLLEALKFSECDEIIMKIDTSAPSLPILFCPLQGDSFNFLILPVLLKRT
ncbi:MAG: DNA polymerase III subunit beta [Clostridia bacterium]